MILFGYLEAKLETVKEKLMLAVKFKILHLLLVWIHKLSQNLSSGWIVPGAYGVQ